LYTAGITRFRPPALGQSSIGRVGQDSVGADNVLKGARSQELLDAVAAASQGTQFVSKDAELLVAGSLDDPVNSLSTRERQIIVMVANGYSSAEVAKELHLSPKTVDSYRSRMMNKLGTPDMASLIKFAIRTGLVKDT